MPGANRWPLFLPTGCLGRRSLASKLSINPLSIPHPTMRLTFVFPWINSPFKCPSVIGHVRFSRVPLKGKMGGEIDQVNQTRTILRREPGRTSCHPSRLCIYPFLISSPLLAFIHDMLKNSRTQRPLLLANKVKSPYCFVLCTLYVLRVAFFSNRTPRCIDNPPVLTFSRPHTQTALQLTDHQPDKKKGTSFRFQQ